MKKVNKVRDEKEKVAVLVKNSRISYSRQLFISEKRRKSSAVRLETGENSNPYFMILIRQVPLAWRTYCGLFEEGENFFNVQPSSASGTRKPRFSCRSIENARKRFESCSMLCVCNSYVWRKHRCKRSVAVFSFVWCSRRRKATGTVLMREQILSKVCCLFCSCRRHALSKFFASRT